MPLKPKKPCSFPGCGKLVDGRYCITHEAQAKQQEQVKRQAYDNCRGTAAQRGYDGKWRKLREQVLKRDRFTCRSCGTLAFRKGQAHVDHIVPKADGGTDDVSNLQTLCANCHSVKTAREDGGYGNMG